MSQNQYVLYDAIQSAITSRLNTMHTASVGIIQSYDSSQQRASVTTAFLISENDGTYSDPVVISNVPVFVLSGGRAAITMPIAAGDKCILIFGEQSLDLWKQSSSQFVTPVGNNLAGLSSHNIVDAIAIVGVNPFPDANKGNQNLHIYNGSSAINMSESTIALGANSVELLSTISGALSQTSTALFNIGLNLSVVSPTLAAVLAPQISAINAAVAAIASVTGTL